MHGSWPERRSVHRDFVEILREFIDADVRFLLIGAHALAAHGLPRATGDIDVWIAANPENAKKAYKALMQFGAPSEQISEADLASPSLVFQMGVRPLRIDVTTSISGVDFEAAWPNRVYVEIEQMRIPVIGRADLLTNKRATGRAQDLVDADRLDKSTSE
jgi:hypothetical protein